jgi:flagellar protein FliO/FliZ
MTPMLTLRALSGLVVVLGLLAGLIWMLRRGSFGIAGTRSRAAIAIETAASLGERRSLVIVKVEGRRLLLGLTPQAVSLVSELTPVPADAAQEGAR